MKKVLLCRLAVAVLVACSMFSAANAGKRSPAKCTRTIELKQTDCKYMRQAIGVDAQGKPCSIVMAYRGGSSSRPSLAPEGIDSVTAASSKSLSVTGVPGAVDKLAGIISKLDITPKTVQIKLETFVVDTKLAEEISPTTSSRVVPTAAEVEAWIAKLREAANSSVISLNLHTLDHIQGEISTTNCMTASGHPTEAEPQYLIETKASAISQILNDTTVNATLIVSFTGDLIGVKSPKGYNEFYKYHSTTQDFILGNTYCIDRQLVLSKTLFTFATFSVLK